MMEYPWIVEAYKHIGLKEIPGKNHNSTIVKWLINLKAWWQDDETPWCGVYVAHCIKTAGLKIPKYYMRAKAWDDEWGVRLASPADGCVVVFNRDGGGHVGFVVGETSKNELLVLGGNQANSVNISKFSKDRVVGYFWPSDFKIPDYYTVTKKEMSGSLSTNEA